MLILGRILLLIFCFALSFDSWRIFTDTAFSIPKLIAIAYFALINFMDGFKLRVYPDSKPVLWILATYSIVFLSTTLFDQSRLETKLISFLMNIILLWSLIKHTQQDSTAIQWGLCGLCIGVLFCYILLFFGIGREINAERRVTFFGDNENALGIRASVAAIILFVFSLEKSNHNLIIRYSGLFFCAICAKLVLDTGSRVAFLSLLSACSFAIMTLTTRSIYFKSFLITLLITSGVSILNYVSTTSVYARLERAIEKADIAGREAIWAEVWPLFYENPFYGIGYSGMHFHLGRDLSPHNVIIEVLVLGGVFGFLCYSAYLLQIIKSAYLAFTVNKNILPLLLLIPMAGAILSAQTLDVKLFYFIPAVAIALGRNESYPNAITNGFTGAVLERDSLTPIQQQTRRQS